MSTGSTVEGRRKSPSSPFTNLAALLFLSAAGLGTSAFPARADDPVGVCVDPRGCNSNSGGSEGSAGYEAGQRLGVLLRCKLGGGDGCPRSARSLRAQAANDEAVALNGSNWVKAVALYQEAVAKDPDQPVYRSNLAIAQAALEREQAPVRDAAATANMKRAIQGFTQTLKAASSTSGLDFDSGSSGSASNAGAGSAGLAFTSQTSSGTATSAVASSTVVTSAAVDGRNVSSGLPQAWEDAITGAYRDAPFGVIDRVRRGFQAIQVKDQTVARAWFGGALALDPGNPRLKALIAAVDAQPPSKPSAQPARLQLPTDDDVLLLSPGVMPPTPDDGPFGPARFRPAVVGSASEPPGGDTSLAFTGYSDTFCPTGAPGKSMRCYVPNWAKKK